MDVDGHLGYIVFMLREGRAPITGELSLPADVANLRARGLASDYVYPGSYARWAALTPAERDTERRILLTPNPSAPYVSDNYEAQHPPLYYAMASAADRPFSQEPFDRQLFWMGALSAVLAAMAVPALYLLFQRRVGHGPALLLVTAVAWFPNLMPFLGRLTNDALAFPIVCWLLWVIDRPLMRRRDIVAGSALLVVGLLTKTYFLALVPPFLAVCLLRAPGERRCSWGSLALGGALLAAGVLPLLATNYAATGMLMPLYEARLTAGEPFWRKFLGLLMVDWVLFPTLMARGFFWSGYWSWVAPGPWYYAPLAAPLALFVPWPHAGRRAGQAAWWAATARQVWVHALAWAVFLAAMWWHAGLLALHARSAHRAQFLGGEGWYLNVLVGSTALILAVAARERYGEARLGRILVWAAAVMVAWNLVARLTLIAFWGGSVRLWSGLRFAWFGDVVGALGSAASWSAWLSWPGVTGPAWLTQAVPLAVALALSAWVVRAAGSSRAG
jgi:hypothetical protein